MEAARTSETSVDNHFTRQYIPEDNSEHHTRRLENLKSHMLLTCSYARLWTVTACSPSSDGDSRFLGDYDTQLRGVTTKVATILTLTALKTQLPINHKFFAKVATFLAAPINKQ
jgi:hypothetical protein